MKKSIFFLLAITLLTSCVTYQKVTFAPDEFVKVYETPGTKDALFLKSNEWMVGIFKDATSVIQHSDKEEGVIIGKYLMFGTITPGAYGTTIDSRVYAIIDIRVKDGKARLAIQPGNYSAVTSMMGPGYTKDKALADLNALADSFNRALLKNEVTF